MPVSWQVRYLRVSRRGDKVEAGLEASVMVGVVLTSVP